MNETPLSADEELVRFLAEPVPMVVTAGLRNAARKDNSTVQGVVTGLFIMLFGAFFVAFFFPWKMGNEWRLAMSGPLKTAGEIVSVETTRTKINGQSVVSYEFKFQPARGPVAWGECFTTGRRWVTGNKVVVRYAPDNPSLACPVGARLSESGWVGVISSVFPLMGAGLIFRVVWVWRRNLWILRNGTLGDFRVTGIDPTAVKINKQQQFKVTLQRLDQADAEPHEVRWYKPALLAFARERQHNGQAIFGLFDPTKPKKVLLPEAWSARG